jgi:hypothetical protein
MPMPPFWSPSFDVVMVYRVLGLGEMGEDVTAFWDACPAELSAIPPGIRPTTDWVRVRTELIAYEASQFVSAELPPTPVSRISIGDRRNILNMLYYFGMPPLRDHWEYFRDLFGQRHLPVAVFRDYVTRVTDEKDVCISRWRREQLLEQVKFLRRVRRGAVTQDLTDIDDLAWPEGPDFWSPKCDAELILSLTRHGFSSTTSLIYENVEHWPLDIQRVIGRKVMRLRRLVKLEELNRTPINPWRFESESDLGNLHVLADIPTVRRRVTKILKLCPVKMMGCTYNVPELLVKLVLPRERAALPPRPVESIVHMPFAIPRAEPVCPIATDESTLSPVELNQLPGESHAGFHVPAAVDSFETPAIGSPFILEPIVICVPDADPQATDRVAEVPAHPAGPPAETSQVILDWSTLLDPFSPKTGTGGGNSWAEMWKTQFLLEST